MGFVVSIIFIKNLTYLFVARSQLFMVLEFVLNVDPASSHVYIAEADIHVCVYIAVADIHIYAYTHSSRH